MTRDEVQQQAFDAFGDKGGTAVLGTGVGKTKLAIDLMKKHKDKTILILYPRTNLRDNWLNELQKWGLNKTVNSNHFYYKDEMNNTQVLTVIFSTIQGIYKNKLFNYGHNYLIIADEIHTMCTDTYGEFFYKNHAATVVGLTATPENIKPDKANFYKSIAPIVYTYRNAAQDGIINNRKYFVFRTDLTDHLQDVPNWKYKISEKEALIYYNRQLKEADEAIRKYYYNLEVQMIKSLGGIPYPYEQFIFQGNSYNSASGWCWGKVKGTTTQKKLGWNYLKAVQERKAFMLNQNTTTGLVEKMLEPYKNGMLEYPSLRKEGILIFSNQITQIQKILNDSFIVHSKKKKKENDQIIFGFNEKIFNRIGSCEALEMGMNFKRAKIAIFESYLGSPTKASQKMGRTDRLPVDENAVIVIIYVNDSPYESWYRKSEFPNFDDPNVTVFTDMNELKKAIQQECQ